MAAEPVAALKGVGKGVLDRSLALDPGPGAARADQKGLVTGRGAVFARERFPPGFAEMRNARGIEGVRQSGPSADGPRQRRSRNR